MPPRILSAASVALAAAILVVSSVVAPRATLAVDAAAATYETLLRAGPEADAPALAPVPSGASLTLTGAPQGDAYPVTYNGTPGWVDAAALTITKDGSLSEPAASATGVDPAAPAPAAATDPALVYPPLTEEMAAPQVGAAPVDPELAVNPQPASVTPEPPADVAASAPGLTPTPTGAELIATAVAGAGDDPAAIATAADAANDPQPTLEPAPEASPAPTEPTEPPAVPATSAEPTAAPDSTPTGEATSVPPEVVTPIPTLAAEATAEPTAEPTAVPSMPPTAAPTDSPDVTTTWGPATAADDLSLFVAPDTGSSVLFYVPEGSTLTQTGTTQGRFVSADFMGIVGWVHRDYLEQPAPPAAEAAPIGTAVPVRTPRPGSGVAFATVELPLRAGPSANEPAVGTVSAGDRVVLTGVMESGFQRVDYRGLIGWLADEYLSTPADPTPALEAPAAPTGVGGGDDRSGRDDRGDRSPESYGRDDIVRIIEQAADRYDQPRGDMLRVAQCESNLEPNAVNPSGSYGLFQFIRSTWKTTPYGDQDIFDPYANANAAAWMWSVGRRNEWVCQ